MTNKDYMMWKRSDRLVKGWIVGSLSEDVLDTVFGLSTAKDVWEKLRASYLPENKEEENEEELPTQHGVEYPYPSMFNVANFITIKLSKVNYNSWVLQILSLVDSLELRNFLMNEPPSLDNYLLWRRTDMLLRGWILGSISEDVITEVFNPDHFSTSRSIMLKIENIFVPGINKRFLSPKPVTTEIENVEEAEMEEDNEEEEIENVEEAETEEDGEEEEIENMEEVPTQQGIRIKEYPYPSTFNVANVVTIKLTKSNYHPWLSRIISLLDIFDMRDFLFKEPPSEVVRQTNEDIHTWKLRNHWERTDKLLRGWIIGSISEDVITTLRILNVSTSRKVMIKIEETLVKDVDQRIISPKSVTEPTEIEKSIGKYMPLYEATLAGDWEATKRILDADEEAATAIISENNFTILHVAVVTGKHIHFVDNLVQYLPTHALTQKDIYGNTALNIAAKLGNTEAAKILMKKNPALFSVRSYIGKLPLHTAINFGNRDTYLYLQSVSTDDHYVGETASEFLTSMIACEYFDLALDLVKSYPHAAKPPKGLRYWSPLSQIATKTSCFRSGMRLNFLESFIYSWVPVKSESFIGGNGDVENPANNHQTVLHHRVHFLGVLCNKLNSMLWDAILLVPSIKIIRQKKLVHHQAVQLVKCLCEAVKSSNHDASFHSHSSKALTTAATFGTLEVVEEILRILPHTIWSRDGSSHTITEIAVINRCEKVFNKTSQMNELRRYHKLHIDNNGNSILHLAGGMAPRHKLNLVSGAALQMQRELQWYKEVERLSNPFLGTIHNSSNETPEMVFTREHKELVIKGEKWMKDTANSCTIAAALIITVVFAAAITAPGGNKDNGSPVFNNTAFLIFAVSDTVSLFMSTTSLLMFLSILTARYAEQDFLHALPKRLVIGLLTLFLSITSMVIAFSSAVYLVFGGRKGWVIIPLAALSCLPVTSFVTLQFPLLIDVYSSTYGRGIFGEQSDRPFHRHIKGFQQYIVKCFASTQKYISHILSSSSSS